MQPWQDILVEYLPTPERLLYWLAIVVLGFSVAQLSTWLSQRVIQSAETEEEDETNGGDEINDVSPIKQADDGDKHDE